MGKVSRAYEGHDYLIIGAGPAGLQLAYFFEQAGRDYLILEAGEVAGDFFRRFPRHRTLISSNKVYTGFQDPEINLRWDWNSLLCDEDLRFSDYSREYFPPADSLVDYLGDFASQAELRIRFGCRVVSVRKEDGSFRVEDDQGRVFGARRLIVATGLHQPYLPPIPGVELTETYCDMPVEPQDFVGQRVLILGKGNSAFETADALIATTSLIHVASPQPVAMAWKTHYVGHLRAVNNNFLDTYQLKSQNAVLDCTVERIEHREGRFAVTVSYTHADGEREVLDYDRVITCTGFRFDGSFFDDSCRPELAIHDRFPAQTSEWESTNVPGLFFAGVLTQVRDFKKATSGFIHGFRYNTRCLFRFLELRDRGVALPSRTVPGTPEGLCDAILERVNRSSALWQQFGFLADLITVDEASGKARYIEELPVAYVHDSELGRHPDYFLVTLEFGKILGDPFAIPREPDPDSAARSTFLHPVVRHFSGDRLLGELHVLENLYGEWRHPEQHVAPLGEFLAREMGTPPPAVPIGPAGAGEGSRPAGSEVF